jgi:hypothetical protein
MTTSTTTQQKTHAPRLPQQIIVLQMPILRHSITIMTLLRKMSAAMVANITNMMTMMVILNIRAEFAVFTAIIEV